MIVVRREALRALFVLLGIGTLEATQGDPVSGREGRHKHRHRRHRHNPRKRLRHQCKKMCKRVQRNCLYVCQNLGNPDGSAIRNAPSRGRAAGRGAHESRSRAVEKRRRRDGETRVVSRKS